MAALAPGRQATPGAFRVHVLGPLTADQAAAWQKQLAPVWRDPVSGIVLDLSEVSYLDMAGLALLLSAFLRARRECRALSLAGLTPQAQKVFRLTPLSQCIPLLSNPLDGPWPSGRGPSSPPHSQEAASLPGEIVAEVRFPCAERGEKKNVHA